MKYMTFNSSCSYAGVANMLEQYGVDTEDRIIAAQMKLPYLFACEDGVYKAGTMLQSAAWFNLYLNPIGYHMTESAVDAAAVPDFLARQKTAMLGLRTGENGKHAVVYIGRQDGKLVFLNNKWKQDPAPERLVLTESELMEKTGGTAVIARLKPIQPKEVDLSILLRDSVTVIRQNLSEIRMLCGREESVAFLRSRLNTVFRPLLLDGITMLELAAESALAQAFVAVQRGLLTALRQAPEMKIRLGDHLPLEQLSAAADGYIRLIEEKQRILHQ